MTRPFPDELLSAFLDDELEPADREQVEQHLATSEADRLLVAELQRLRGELTALPPVQVSDNFTDRVLAAALAEAERSGMAVGPFDVTQTRSVSEDPTQTRSVSKGSSIDLTQTRSVSEGSNIDPVTPSSNGSAASVLPEPGFTGILAAEPDAE
ncbi:MAG TPA: zf-HC2 domain-containing protein [Pirellulaceae bacterium]